MYQWELDLRRNEAHCIEWVQVRGGTQVELNVFNIIDVVSLSLLLVIFFLRVAASLACLPRDGDEHAAHPGWLMPRWNVSIVSSMLPGVLIPDDGDLSRQDHGASAPAAAGPHVRSLPSGGGGSNRSSALHVSESYAETWSGIYEGKCSHVSGSYILYFAQTLLSLNAIPCFLRVLNWMTVWEDLGTLSVILGELMKDVRVFFFIFIPILIGFASAFVGLMPTLGDGAGTFRSNGPFQAPFWAVYGEFGDLEGLSRHSSLPGTAMMWMYAFLSEVLLVNLLIAMMTET
jgi:hypothetical protein